MTTAHIQIKWLCGKAANVRAKLQLLKTVYQVIRTTVGIRQLVVIYPGGREDNVTPSSRIYSSRSFLQLGLESSNYPRNTSMLSSAKTNVSASQEEPTLSRRSYKAGN